MGLISYRDESNSALKVAHCSNVLCTSATASTIDSPGDTGRTPSLTIGVDGLGLIAYFDATNQDLRIAHLSNVNGTPHHRDR
jgi:hypothetical protein